MKAEKEQNINIQEEVKDQSEKHTEAKKVEEEKVETEAKEEDSLEVQLSEAKEKYLRLYSEFENFRRRTAKEKLDLISTANKDLMSELLPVVDDFERAMSATGDGDEKSLKEGITLVQSKLVRSLEARGLKKMKVAKGDDFDDEKHEAITQIPAEKDLEGKIVDIIESGYYLKETVVRFAKVVTGTKQ